MRRVHPQRAKPPVQSNSDKPSSGGVVRQSLNYESKAWTTHSELHKKYTSDNSNNTLEQAVSQARLTTTHNAAVTTTSTLKPFMISASPITQHSQEQESGTVKQSQNLSGKLPATRTSNHNKNNSTNGGARRKDRGKVGKKAPVAIIGDEDIDDSDFDLPGIDELFSDAVPRKIRRVESSEIANKASKHSNLDMIVDEQLTAKANTAEDDPWLMSDLQVDQDMDLFTPSPTSNHGELLARNVNGPPHKILPAMSTRSTVSQTQNALNEIDRLFINGSPTRSPSTRFQSPFEDHKLNEQRSPTPYVGATGIYLPDQNMDDCGADEVVLFEDPQQDELMGGNSVIVSDGQGIGQPVTGDNVKLETQDKIGVGPQEDPSVAAVSEQASEAVEQAAEESEPPKLTHTFTLPHSSSAFKERLKELSSGFQTSMDDMMDAIIDVEHLRTSVEKTLTDRQELLHQRGERIHCQARQLQEEASTLHSKTRDNMLRAIQHE